MDFLVGLFRTRKGMIIFVVFDRFIKHAHFIPTKSIMSTIDVAKLFICEFFHLQGLPKQIIGHWD